MRIPFVTAIVVSGLLCVGCKGADHDHDRDHDGPTSRSSTPDQTKGGATMAAMVNSTCPMMTEKIDPDVTVVYAGKKVGFCCWDCVPEWKKLSDAEKKVRLAKSK